MNLVLGHELFEQGNFFFFGIHVHFKYWMRPHLSKFLWGYCKGTKEWLCGSSE